MQHPLPRQDWTVSESGGGRVEPLEPAGWRLSIPPGPKIQYRWAQIDDYRPLARRAYLWQPPVWLEIEARASADDLLGTWGFGLWNNPFAVTLMVGGADRGIPALPNVAWFFFASPPNSLSLRDDQPAQGFLAATFRSPHIPTLVLAPGAVLIPLLALRPAARLIRRMARLLIRDTAAAVPASPSEWHTYGLAWESRRVRFFLDGRQFHQTHVSPRGPLGFVLWIDNQFAAFNPRGEIGFGNLETSQPQSLEIRSLTLREGLPD